MQVFLIIVCGLAAGAVVALAGMIAFGTSAPPKPLASIGDPFKTVDFSDLPAAETVAARRGSPITFRHWDPPDPGSPERVVIAIHGSSASGSSLHPLAKALRAAGFTVYASDIRGHGATGERGDIDYAGQLDDDLADLTAMAKARHPNAQLALLGFSSGGGFALHAAATPLATAFARIVLISPFLGPFAPTVRPKGGTAWAKAFVPRIIALAVLERFGIHAFEHLPVIAFRRVAGTGEVPHAELFVPAPARLRHHRLRRRPAQCLGAARGPGRRKGRVVRRPTALPRRSRRSVRIRRSRSSPA